MEQVEKKHQLPTSPWEGKMLKHFSSAPDFEGTGHGTLMGPGIFLMPGGSHENQRQLVSFLMFQRTQSIVYTAAGVA